jgi:hypothetical protein
MKILAALADGMRATDVAAQFCLHKSRITQIKRKYSSTVRSTPDFPRGRPAA